MKYYLLAISLIVSTFLFSQKKMKQDTISSDVKTAREQIVKLKHEGALVVRLFLTKKKIGLYRKYGKEKLANDLQVKLDQDNDLTILAFSDSTFSFCPVYFINTKDYGRVINGDKSGYFLNKDLEIDTSIIMAEDYFLFVERGPVYDQVAKANSFTSSETSSTPTVSDAIVIKDKNMNQLAKPFPFFKKIYFSDNTKSNIGFYVPRLNNAKGGTWLTTPPLSISEKLAIKDKKDEYTDRIEAIEKRFGMSVQDLSKFSRNITTYYKNEYSLKKNELTLPFNIYKLNVKLTNFYYSAVDSLQKEKEKAEVKKAKEEERLKKNKNSK